MAGDSSPSPLSMLLPVFLCASIAAAAAAAVPGRLEPHRRNSVSKLGTSVLITGNSTLVSPNQTFEIGFFPVDAGSRWYFGVWYAAIPIRTYVWVANRDAPVSGDLTPATVRMTAEGVMTVRDNSGRDVWRTDNAEPAGEAKLLETGNLVLLSADGSGRVVWQSFDHPADTWLPNMSVTSRSAITSWRSAADPSPGPYSLRLKPPDYGEFQLVYGNGTLPPVAYWSTGMWMGDRFTGVPEMTVPYIYSFRFDNPFTPDATFVYSEAPSASVVLRPFLTRFVVEPSGQLRQYTWSAQASSWNMFWSRPENPCRVYALCGDMGLCRESGRHPCDCLAGFRPSDPAAWGSDDYLGGCSLEEGGQCSADSAGGEFEEVGPVEFDGASMVSFPSQSRDSCQQSCRQNCSCRGINFDSQARICRIFYGNLFNLRNSTASPVLYVRVGFSDSSSPPKKDKSGRKWRTVAISAGGVGVFLAISGAAFLAWMLWGRGRRKTKRGRGAGEDKEDVLVMSNLRVFSYKELSTATRGFSEELGHGGFGAVFRGELPDSSLVAVKRLQRPGGGGDREFRAEVRTIGSIHHVNLVRLRGFCSEDPHRLLVYEYMHRGPLSAYLGRRPHQHRRHPQQQPQEQQQQQQQQQQQFLSWEDRMRVAVGTARGIAYLHEECRDCIVHCDIKPENILLDGDYTPKVSDFGLAKLIGRDFSRVLTTMRGTWGYVAPEWISGVAITAKADVYSYGMTLLELISGRRNVETPPVAPGGGETEEVVAEDGEDKWFLPPWAARQIVEGNVAAVVDPRLLGAYDVREAERAALAAVWCIQDHEGARPTMGQVVKMLEGTVEVSVPPLPQLLQALVSGDSFRRVGVGSGEASRGSTSLGCGDYDNDSAGDKISDTSAANGR